MKRQLIMVFFLLMLFSSITLAFEPASKEDSALIRKRLVPLPVEYVFGTQSVRIDNRIKVVVMSENTETAKEIVEKIFPKWFITMPRLSTEKTSEAIPVDGYKLHIEKDTITITASNSGGILNALKTLRQLVEPNRDTEKVQYYIVPELDINDFPALGFRGMHLCWFPETDPVRIEQAIRLASYYKFNYIVLEMWGTYQFEKRPEFCWAEHSVDKKEIRRLVGIGRELGITLVPQFNLFGHASASRGCSSKHAILDFHPEYQPLFEPDGWTWCLSNPATRAVLTDLVLEFYDAFDNPPFFHIGCDEAYSAATCPVCRHADYGKLFIDHLTYFCNLLKERNCRTMMWHDMLIERTGSFAGYVAGGNARTAGLLDKLSKEMIICDWQYSAPKKDEQWPTTRFFKSQGFDVIVCPWNVRTGIESLGKLAVDEKLFGLLETTWHHLDGPGMRTMFATGARATWGTAHSGYDATEVDCHLRQVGWDMDKKNYRYEQTGIYPWQLNPRPSGGR